jgi:hypothetical protein
MSSNGGYIKNIDISGIITSLFGCWQVTSEIFCHLSNNLNPSGSGRKEVPYGSGARQVDFAPTDHARTRGIGGGVFGVCSDYQPDTSDNRRFSRRSRRISQAVRLAPLGVQNVRPNKTRYPCGKSVPLQVRFFFRSLLNSDYGAAIGIVK